jgi:hypothetical protein
VEAQKLLSHFLLCIFQNLHCHLQWIREFARRTISRMNYAIELKILECKGTQYDKFGFWKLEYLKISSSFFSSAYYVHCFVFGWFWMQMRHKLENQWVPTPIQYIEFQVSMQLQFCVLDIMWKNSIVLFLYHCDRLQQGSIWIMWRALTSIFNLGSYI